MVHRSTGRYNREMLGRSRGEGGNAGLWVGVAVLVGVVIIALVQGLVIQEVGIPGVASIKFGERSHDDGGSTQPGDPSSDDTGGGGNGGGGSGSVVEGSWVGERGAIRVEVTRAENQSGHLRLTASVTNGTGDSVTLPIFHNATAVTDDGTTYQVSPRDSSFPETVPSGQTLSGVIEFEGLYAAGRGTMTLSFATIFGFDAPSGSLVISGVRRPPR